MRRPALALAALALAALAPALALARGPSTPTERRRAVETTRRLEQQPLAKSSNAERRWLLQWIVEIPDIHVQGCSGPLDALAQDQDGERYGRLLFVQSMFGMAAYQVEHPKEKDWVTIQTAGIESVLRAYRSLLRSEPNARWEELDALLVAAKAGQLEAVVEKTMEGCGEEHAPGPGDAI
ncbi:hypothetical protein [Anaeromyxobacter oryzae]|uniref:Uncharacterized protein n=1 Tax=Anaeromyxobacter oryzae TaxID=2918170 RepID=A0ABM7WQ65_9BACT|nr:hypothetical protein [Anaeromyxobacter oryzae]BDG01606.1 hypothetical protein AMOR_06020 [Anaeromyxobacter oryzae]